MSSSLQRFRVASASQLLSHILERPQLVSAVRELPPSALSRLIDHIGLEDAGELVALATPEQLADLFDADLWRADAPGRQESFDAQRFALWLSVIGESGQTFLVEKLVELPRDLLTLAVHRLVLVLDMDAWAEDVHTGDVDADETERALESCLGEEWEEFRLIARAPELWDEIYDALLALDRDHHALLRQILERCRDLSAEQIDDYGGLYETLSAHDILEEDALAERDERRAERGFVAPADARSFLELARIETALPSTRDAVTRAHFRVQPTTPPASPRAPQPSAAATTLLQLVAASTATDVGPRRKQLRAPHELPAVVSDPGSSLLVDGLAQLQREQPALHAQRSEELSYLANVLISGAEHRGRRFRPAEALEAALATCNLGLQLWPQASLLEVGCDQLFRWGFRSLQRDLVLPARRALVEACAGVNAEAAERVRAGSVFSIAELCSAQELGLDDSLLALAETLPWRDGAQTEPWFRTSEQVQHASASLLRAHTR